MQVSKMRKCCDVAFLGMCVELRMIVKMAKDRAGATIIEYGLLAGLVSIAALAGFQVTGVAIAGMYDSMATIFDASLSPSP